MLGSFNFSCLIEGHCFSRLISRNIEHKFQLTDCNACAENDWNRRLEFTIDLINKSIYEIL